MKLLITGGAGKVGQAIVRELLNSAAYEITVLDRTPGPERGPVNYLVGDIQDLGQVMEAMAGAEAVIHLAAIHNPNIAPTTVTYQTNVVGTFNVHHAAFRLGVKRIVSASSNAIVGWSYSERFMPDYLPIDEDHPLRARRRLRSIQRDRRNHRALLRAQGAGNRDAAAERCGHS